MALETKTAPVGASRRQAPPRRRRRPAPRKSCSTPRRPRSGSATGRSIWIRPPPAAQEFATRISARRRSRRPAETPLPRQLLRAAVLRRGGPRLSPVGARQGRQQQLGERLGLHSVHQLADEQQRHRGVADRHDVGGGGQSRGLQRLRTCRAGAGRTTATATTSLGQPIYFASTGRQTLRVQVREDGLSIDQIVLSHTVFASTPPGTLKNDTTILAEADGSGTPPPPPPPPPPPATPEIRALGGGGARQGRMAGGTRHVCRRRLEALESERESGARSRRPRPPGCTSSR